MKKILLAFVCLFLWTGTVVADSSENPRYLTTMDARKMKRQRTKIEEFIRGEENPQPDFEEVTLKQVKLWNGEMYFVEEEFERMGNIAEAELSPCSNSETEVMLLVLKDVLNKTVCLSATPITPQNELRWSLLENEELKEEYKGKVINIKGYGLSYTVPSHNFFWWNKSYKVPKMHLSQKDIHIDCDEYIRLYVSDVKIQ